MLSEAFTLIPGISDKVRMMMPDIALIFRFVIRSPFDHLRLK